MLGADLNIIANLSEFKSFLSELLHQHVNYQKDKVI